jgi:hypothetical protein
MSKSKVILRSLSDIQVLRQMAEALSELDARGYEFNGTSFDGDIVSLLRFRAQGKGSPSASITFSHLTWDLSKLEEFAAEHRQVRRRDSKGRFVSTNH